ncbi:MAG: NADP(+)-dependent, decarboxylating phosphogluconate dehydrogenase [Pyrinomonadaceae bacterium]
MEHAHFGMIGLGTMGRNFLLNAAEHGIPSVGYDLDETKRQLLVEEGKGFPVQAAATPAELVSMLAAPRNIMLLVPAGPIVDSVIRDLLPLLEKDDLIIDAGNSHFTDTEIREAFLKEKGIEFMGIGVSGGEEGARHGASIMPGGNRAFYDRVAPVLQAVSAKVNGEPCVDYMGASSAGHFVKMVHNGIEYGLMQILAETYDFMKRVLRMNYEQMSDTFAAWNDSELNSFLVEITAEVLRKADAETGLPLVEVILDKAAQKGTGKWTSQAAMDLGVPIPTIDSAVAMRQISAQKETRILIAKKFGTFDSEAAPETPGDATEVTSIPQFDYKAALASRDVTTAVSEHHKEQLSGKSIIEAEFPVTDSEQTEANEEVRQQVHEDLDQFVGELKNALLCSFIVTYAQGMSLLQIASHEKDYGLDLSDIAKIWRGGCIIRSALLEEMRRAFAENPQLPNLMLDDKFAEILSRNRGDWRTVAAKFSSVRIPAASLSASLAYFDAFRSERLPANLIQAQRDFFGAHTYQRTDKEGVFHTPDWDK